MSAEGRRVGRAQEGKSPSRKGGSEDLRGNCSIINACKCVLEAFGGGGQNFSHFGQEFSQFNINGINTRLTSISTPLSVSSGIGINVCI